MRNDDLFAILLVKTTDAGRLEVAGWLDVGSEGQYLHLTEGSLLHLRGVWRWDDKANDAQGLKYVLPRRRVMMSTHVDTVNGPRKQIVEVVAYDATDVPGRILEQSCHLDSRNLEVCAA